MRKLLISIATAASALAVTTPASAQYFPAPQGYGYGYQHSYGQVRQLHARVTQLRQRIERLDRVNRLSRREARRLDRHAIELHRRVEAASYRGLSRYERYDIERRIEGLRQAIRYEARDGNRWGWNGYDRSDNAYGYYGARYQRDHERWHDRNDDRYEDRHEEWHDRRDDDHDDD